MTRGAERDHPVIAGSDPQSLTRQWNEIAGQARNDGGLESAMTTLDRDLASG